GAWSSLWEESERDAGGNITKGDVYARSMSNSLVISEDRLIAAVGLQDVIIIETPDAVLAAHKERVQEVKELVEQLKRDGRPEQENHVKINRPWGSFETVDSGDRFQVKRLTIRPGEVLSLQMHHHRAEHWVVVKGTAKVTRGDEEFLLTENQSTYVPVGVIHRLENPGTLPLEVVEVQTGSYLEEDDIVRFEDRYDRHIYDNL
ncbi:MAG: cupin domain-containing protein, partial [Chloroflexi bacterium]|nr:cupin domain-containing protein [Chloroflexota bacterium]